MLNISETKQFRGFVSNTDPIGKCLRRVEWCVIEDVTCVQDVKLVMSPSSRSSHSETRTRINYLCGSFKQTLSHNILLKKSSHSA